MSHLVSCIGILVRDMIPTESQSPLKCAIGVALGELCFVFDACPERAKRRVSPVEEAHRCASEFRICPPVEIRRTRSHAFCQAGLAQGR